MRAGLVCYLLLERPHIGLQPGNHSLVGGGLQWIPSLGLWSATGWRD